MRLVRLGDVVALGEAEAKVTTLGSGHEGRTIDALDPPAWGPAAGNDTSLVRRCHQLRKTPLSNWDLDDLRLMIGQQISLPILMPRAIDVLAQNPLAEGIFPGDLLFMVLTVDASYWHANVEQWDRVDGIVDSLAATYEYVRGPIDHFKFGIWK